MTSTPYADAMLFWECVKGRYYAGQISGSSLFDTRSANTVFEGLVLVKFDRQRKRPVRRTAV